MKGTVHAADLFAGAGGTSTGLILACKSLERGIDLLAVNHWEEAIKAHSANYPWARHICQRIEAVMPREVVPGGHLNLMVASPECTFHSVARGGRPINDQLRASPWHLLPWLQELVVDSLLVENVPEFQKWGPLNAKGRPMKAQAGETYKAWLGAIRSLGYNVDARILNSADYGDATSRRRLFVIARRGRKPITFPAPTHSKGGTTAGTKPWVAAREVIDWSIKGESIFGRKRSLSPHTIARIAEGLRRFGGPQLRPFLVGLVGRNLALRSVDEPMPAPTGHGAGALVEPFLVEMEHGGRIRSIEEPLSTITTAKGGAFGVAAPYLVQYNGASQAQPVTDPMPTVTTRDRFGLVQPIVDGYTLDIRFRMLQPHELSAAMGFPKGYVFTGTRTEATKQIGNAVSVQIAKALCLSLLAPSVRTTLGDVQ